MINDEPGGYNWIERPSIWEKIACGLIFLIIITSILTGLYLIYTFMGITVASCLICGAAVFLIGFFSVE